MPNMAHIDFVIEEEVKTTDIASNLRMADGAFEVFVGEVKKGILKSCGEFSARVNLQDVSASQVKDKALERVFFHVTVRIMFLGDEVQKAHTDSFIKEFKVTMINK